MFRRPFILSIGILSAFGWLGAAALATATAPESKKGSAAEVLTVPKVIKSETNLVLVDVVVTGKKKRYLDDLKRKDFRVFDNGKEQPIVSFSRAAEIQPGAPGRRRYIVLFFDNAGLDPESKLLEHDAVSKFVAKTASPNRLMTVMDMGIGLQVAQTFTADRDLLLSALRKVDFSANQITQRGGYWSPFGAQGKLADLSLRDLLLALQDVARMLGKAPGRKTLLFFSTGFNLTSNRQIDFQDTVEALNRANVGVYPVVPTGLTSFGSFADRPGWGMYGRWGSPGSDDAVQVLYALAAGTGGFPVVDTNDLQAGMEKVSEEMNEFYLLGYVPPNPVHDGSYHTIRVKVDLPGAKIRARGGYSDTTSHDILTGKVEGKVLEAKAESLAAGDIPVSLSLPYFYLKPGVARVNLALSIPGSDIDFEKHGDHFRSQLSVLGIAYKDDGSPAARFSDTMNLDYERNQERQVAKGPFHYRESFKIAPGDYTLKLAVSAGGKKFGKYVAPLIVDPFSGKQFTLSGPAFGDGYVPSPLRHDDVDQSLITGSAPMVANGMQLVPSSSDRFKATAHPLVYVEVYDPLLKSSNPLIEILYRIVDAATKHKVYSSQVFSIGRYVQPGHPLVPVIFNLPVGSLAAGSYRMEIQARDSSGNISSVRAGDFSVE